MPIYDYDCAECGRRIEVVHGVHAPGPTHCPNCGGGPLRKAISAPAVHFKGSGWAKKERHAAVASATSRTGDTSNAGDGDSKSPEGDATAASAKDGTSKNEPAAPPDSSPDKPGDRNRREGRPAASSKPAGAGTATKTD